MGFELTDGISDLSVPIAEGMLPPIPSFGLSHNDSSLNCQNIFCNLFDEIGPPPDWLLPPPPIPPYLAQLLIENNSLIADKAEDCNFCHIFSNPTESELVIPESEFKTHDSWYSLLISSVVGSTILCIILLFILVKFRKWKVFPSSVCGLESCPIFPESMTRGQKAAPPCNPSENYISPVINEKSPQSVISCPNATPIPSKYWRCNNENTESRGNIINQRRWEIEDYTNIPEGNSCSPVYAELDASEVTINHSQIPKTLLMNGPIPYNLHTYSEVADAMRMAALGSSTALMPDASYDNVVYLPSSNNDLDQGRSLGRQRPGHNLGSAVPLLPTHQQFITSSQLNYLTNGRSHKKPRSAYSHQMSRPNTRNQHQHQMQPEIGSHYMIPHRPDAIYTDLPLNSPSLSTLRGSYGPNLRGNPKRPLPSVPGVRL